MLRQISLLPGTGQLAQRKRQGLYPFYNIGFIVGAPTCPRSCDVEEVSWKSPFARWFFVADNYSLLFATTFGWQEDVVGEGRARLDDARHTPSAGLASESD
jgi:hypothetical protein